MGTFAQDLSYSLRSLGKVPAFTAVAIVTLALGVGANSAIFSVVNAVLLRPLPFAEAERLVHLAWDGNGYLQSLSAMKFQYWHDYTRSFESMATWRSSVARAALDGAPSTIRLLAASRDFFAVVGNAVARGHGFTPADFGPGGPSVAIVSHAMWETRFGRATDVAARIPPGRSNGVRSLPATSRRSASPASPDDRSGPPMRPVGRRSRSSMTPLRAGTSPARIRSDCASTSAASEGPSPILRAKASLTIATGEPPGASVESNDRPPIRLMPSVSK